MKFICLGYYDETKWVATPEKQIHAMMDECFDYDDVLRRNGHFAGGEALGSSQEARTLSCQSKKMVIAAVIALASFFWCFLLVRSCWSSSEEI